MNFTASKKHSNLRAGLRCIEKWAPMNWFEWLICPWWSVGNFGSCGFGPLPNGLFMGDTKHLQYLGRSSKCAKKGNYVDTPSSKSFAPFQILARKRNNFGFFPLPGIQAAVNFHQLWHTMFSRCPMYDGKKYSLKVAETIHSIKKIQVTIAS